ncbi:hypothetical protein J1N35_015559 [Gossypium stocksii]|uniref:Endonuclease/exonuclease/phosphatase domain-containing protein n=1 Tax=Gossypium stocksii TaxID=47602 RepID=A0A9D3VXE3_9ROSI|nr:hypothetical protein J1N35_015559 [Gossypium stocksii]
MEHKPDIISLLEPRVSGTKADSVIAKLGLQCSHRVEAISYSWGIWIGWKESVRFEVVLNHPQFILSRVWHSSLSHPIFIAFVYGSPNKQMRQFLWSEMRKTILSSQYLWIAIRDFNAILSSSEKSRGLSKGKRCHFFGDFVDSANLFDLGFQGPPFTWHKGALFERLDRALANEFWIHNFSNCMVTHLSKIKSDHRPLLVSLNPSIILPRGRMFFRFLAGWVEHPDFDGFLKGK